MIVLHYDNIPAAERVNYRISGFAPRIVDGELQRSNVVTESRPRSRVWPDEVPPEWVRAE